MKRESFGSYLTLDNRGERIRLFIPPKPPVSSDLSFSAEQRKAMSNTLFSLGKLQGTAEVSQLTGKLAQLSKFREFSYSIDVETSRSRVIDYLLDLSNESHLSRDLAQNSFARSLKAFDRCSEILSGKVTDNANFWKNLESSLGIESESAQKATGFIGKGSGFLNSPSLPAERINEGLKNLHDLIFKNRLQLDPLDSAGIFAGTILMLNAYQGETILVARIVSLALLKRAGLMAHSVINVGRVLETRKPQITEAMSRLRNDGDWEEWIAEFAEILSQAAEETSRFNQQITDLYLSDRDKAASLGRPAESIHRVLEILIESPVTNSNFLVQKTGLTPATVNKSLRHLSDLGVIHEMTSQRRNRIFRYTAVLDLLSN